MTTSSPLPFAFASLQLTSAPKLSYIYTPIHSSTQRSYPISSIRMCGISALPEKKTGPKKIRRKISPSPSSDAQDLVRSIVRSISDKQPLLKTLDKYVQFIRTEHCFMLFEELGRSERWLQCLEFQKPERPKIVDLKQISLSVISVYSVHLPECCSFDIIPLARVRLCHL